MRCGAARHRNATHGSRRERTVTSLSKLTRAAVDKKSTCRISSELLSDQSWSRCVRLGARVSQKNSRRGPMMSNAVLLATSPTKKRVVCLSFYPRDAMLARCYTTFASVCPCVTRTFYIKTAKHFVEIILPPDSPIILVFHRQGSLLNSDGFTPNWGSEYKEWENWAFFDQ